MSEEQQGPVPPEAELIHDEEAEPTIEEMELSERKQAKLKQLQEEYNGLITAAGECQYRIYSMQHDLTELNRKAREINREAAGIAQEARANQAKRQKAMARKLSKMKLVENDDGQGNGISDK